MARVGRYRHYLGPWDAAERVRVSPGAKEPAAGLAWQTADAQSLDALASADVLGDAARIADAEDGVIAAMTVPARVKRRLWSLEWGESGPTDERAFAGYGRSVVAFFRAAGVPLAEPCATKLVAAAPGTTKTSASALVNVGDSECLVATTAEAGVVSMRVPPGEACLLSRAGSYTVIVPQEAEFGLLLEVG